MILGNARLLATAVILSGLLAMGSSTAQETRRSEFGQTRDGQGVDVFRLTNADGYTASVMTWGATLIGLEVPDREGKRENITLHLGTFAEYESGHPLFGSVVGRYANRIDRGGFEIDGRRFDLKTVNPRTNVHIHGGKEGFAKRLWEGKVIEGEGYAGAEFALTSPDGHEGYPGEVKVRVIYRLTNENALEIEYVASTTKPTHLNLTNHAYFNLAGAGSGDVLDHLLTLDADQLLAVDDRKIPTGEFLPVERTPFDFRKLRAIGAEIGEVDGGGYDHCFVLGREPSRSEPRWFARLEDPASGRRMDVETTSPGVQLYTGNYLKPSLKTPAGIPYGPHHGVCLETQGFPDSPNQPDFPSTLLRPGEEYRQKTVFRFSVDP